MLDCCFSWLDDLLSVSRFVTQPINFHFNSWYIFVGAASILLLLSSRWHECGPGKSERFDRAVCWRGTDNCMMSRFSMMLFKLLYSFEISPAMLILWMKFYKQLIISIRRLCAGTHFSSPCCYSDMHNQSKSSNNRKRMKRELLKQRMIN